MKKSFSTIVVVFALSAAVSGVVLATKTDPKSSTVASATGHDMHGGMSADTLKTLSGDTYDAMFITNFDNSI